MWISQDVLIGSLGDTYTVCVHKDGCERTTMSIVFYIKWS